MNGGVIFLLVLLFLLLFSYGGWVLWSRIQANRLGLPPPSLNPFARSSSSGSSSNYPSPAPGGIKGFINNTIYKIKNRNNRSAAGAYEGNTGDYNSAPARGRGNRLDPDEAWSARVGDEAYYEEQELGLQGPPGQGGHNNTAGGGYSNTAYGAPSPGFANPQSYNQEPERGRSRTREYDEGGLHSDSRSARDPFGDENAAPSLRGVSPRPLDHGQDTSYGGGAPATTGPAVRKVTTGNSDQNSPTERRSMFRENM